MHTTQVTHTGYSESSVIWNLDYQPQKLPDFSVGLEWNTAYFAQIIKWLLESARNGFIY